MHKVLECICEGFSFSGDIASDALEFLIYHGRQSVADHAFAVANRAQGIARRFNVDSELARCAGLLHDISLVVPPSNMVQMSLELGIDLVEVETQIPYLIHGKLSSAIAKKVFYVNNDLVTNAISCHTTLRGDPTSLDKVLFVADKLSWDPEHSPFRSELEKALEKSLDHAAGCFLTWIWDQRDTLDVIHPWLSEAVEEFKAKGFCKM